MRVRVQKKSFQLKKKKTEKCNSLVANILSFPRSFLFHTCKQEVQTLQRPCFFLLQNSQESFIKRTKAHFLNLQVGLILLQEFVIMRQLGNSEAKAVYLNTTCLPFEITKSHSRKSFHLTGSREAGDSQPWAEQNPHFTTNSLSLAIHQHVG